MRADVVGTGGQRAESVARTVVACVLAGGTGTRLYPASRSARPKQFLALDGEESLLARTVDRVGFADETVVLTGEPHADAAREHAPDTEVFVEPAAKDTGPALAYAARRVRETYGECVMLCVPADHHVEGDFAAVARDAVAVASDTDGLVTMGVEPTRPATGYGYIEPGEFERLGDDPEDGSDGDGDGIDGGGEYAPVRAFREKPDRDTAASLRELGCLWNAGVFAWTADAFLAACEGTPLEPLVDGDLAEGFANAPSLSVDYAVLERTDRAFVVPATFAWDDLGSWDALGRVLDTDADGNATLGDATLLDTEDAVVASDDKHVSVVDGDGLVVAAFDDRVLVVPREASQRVRDVVAELRGTDRF